MTRRAERSIALFVGAAAMLVLLLEFAACSGTWRDQAGRAIGAVQIAADSTWTIARKAYQRKCGAIAKACKTSPCKALDDCHAERRRVAAAVKGVHRSVQALILVLPIIEEARR